MRHRIILEYNEQACQWEWEIQRFQPMIGDNGLTEWEDIIGDDFAGQNEKFVEAAYNALAAYEDVNGRTRS